MATNTDFDDIIVGLMFNYVKQFYPVGRVKHKTRFKRGVHLDNQVCLLPKDNYVLFSDLFSQLKCLYCATDGEITHVITNFYGIRR